MRLTVEFFGLPRRLSGEKKTLIEVGENATLRDVNAELVKRFPAFLGPLVVPETHELVESYFFYNMDAAPGDKRVKEGDRLLLMFVDAGG